MTSEREQALAVAEKCKMPDVEDQAAVVRRLSAEVTKLTAALEEASDIAIGLCVACRQNICDKQFLTYAHDEVGVAIIHIRNKAIDNVEPADQVDEPTNPVG